MPGQLTFTARLVLKRMYREVPCSEIDEAARLIVATVQGVSSESSTLLFYFECWAAAQHIAYGGGWSEILEGNSHLDLLLWFKYKSGRLDT